MSIEKIMETFTRALEDAAARRLTRPTDEEARSCADRIAQKPDVLSASYNHDTSSIDVVMAPEPLAVIEIETIVRS